MKLRNILGLAVFVVFLISVLILSLFLFSNFKANMEKQVTDHLESVSTNLEDNINTFLEGQENKIELIANQNELTNEELAEMIKTDDSFYDMFVIDSNGTVIRSSNPARIGLFRGNRTYFTEARNQTYISPVYLALVPQQYSIAVSTPFHGGVLVGAMKVEVLDRFVSSRTGMGETGESLLAFRDVNGNTVYFSQRLFSNQSMEVLTAEQAKTRPIYYALEGQEKLLIGASDYRGVSVLAVTNYIEKIKIGMVTKMDSSEAFAEINVMQNEIIIIAAIVVLVGVLVIYIILRRFSKQIVQLSDNVESVTKGRFDVQLGKSNADEIQQLIDSLNRILASMKLAILRTGASKEEIGVGEAVKAKQEAEDKYKILYNTSTRAIMTLEPPSWKFTAGNPATMKIFGVKDEEELTKLGPWDVSPKLQPDGKSSAEKAKKMIEKAMKEGSAHFKWIHKRYKGKDFPAEVLLTKTKINGEDVVQAMVTDLSSEPVKK